MNSCPFCGFNEGWVKPFKNNFKVECNVCKSTGPMSKTYDGAKRKWNGYIKNEVDVVDKNELETALLESIHRRGGAKDFAKKYEKLISTYHLNPGDIKEATFIINTNLDKDVWIKRRITPYKLDIIKIQKATFSDKDQITVSGPIERLLAWADIFYDGAQNFLEKNILTNKLTYENVGAPMSTLSNTPGVGNAVPATTVGMTGSQQGAATTIGSGDNWDNFSDPHTQGGKVKRKKKKKINYKKNNTKTKKIIESKLDFNIAKSRELENIEKARRMWGIDKDGGINKYMFKPGFMSFQNKGRSVSNKGLGVMIASIGNIRGSLKDMIELNKIIKNSKLTSLIKSINTAISNKSDEYWAESEVLGKIKKLINRNAETIEKEYKNLKNIKDHPNYMGDNETNESCLNPYDKIGEMMAKKMKVPIYFKKSANQSTNQKMVEKTKTGKISVQSYTDFSNLINK